MTGLKNKTWTNQPIKNHKKGPWTQTHQTTETTEKSRTHVFKFFTPLTPSVEKNCEFSWVQENL